MPLVSRRDLFLPTIVLDRCSFTPLHRQVGDQIARAIRGGVSTGSRLPSSRLMARLLGVSRNTVLTAYDDLVAAGLISGRRGAGMLVAAGSCRAAASGEGAGLHILDPQRVLRQAQYPARTLHVVDPDGTLVYLAFR